MSDPLDRCESIAMSSTNARTSLVFGVVAASGTPLDAFLDGFSSLLNRYDYRAVPIRLTELLHEHVAEPGSMTWNDEGERLEALMDAGDGLRAKLQKGNAMARLAALGIAEKRRELGDGKPSAYIIRQLKHPDEASTLRRIYGDRLFVLSLYSTSRERFSYLTEVRAISAD